MLAVRHRTNSIHRTQSGHGALHCRRVCFCLAQLQAAQQIFRHHQLAVGPSDCAGRAGPNARLDCNGSARSSRLVQPLRHTGIAANDGACPTRAPKRSVRLPNPRADVVFRKRRHRRSRRNSRDICAHRQPPQDHPGSNLQQRRRPACAGWGHQSAASHRTDGRLDCALGKLIAAQRQLTFLMHASRAALDRCHGSRSRISQNTAALRLRNIVRHARAGDVCAAALAACCGVAAAARKGNCQPSALRSSQSAAMPVLIVSSTLRVRHATTAASMAAGKRTAPAAESIN